MHFFKFFEAVAVALLFFVAFTSSEDCSYDGRLGFKEDHGCLLGILNRQLDAIFSNTYIVSLILKLQLGSVFDTSESSAKVADIYYNVLIKTGNNLCLPEEETVELAKQFADTINKTFDALTPCSFAEVHSLSAAHILKDSKVLNRKNVLPLALKFSNNTVKNIKSGDYGTVYEALAVDLGEFLVSEGVLSVKTYARSLHTYLRTLTEVYNSITCNSQ